MAIMQITEQIYYLGYCYEQFKLLSRAHFVCGCHVDFMQNRTYLIMHFEPRLWCKREREKRGDKININRFQKPLSEKQRHDLCNFNKYVLFANFIQWFQCGCALQRWDKSKQKNVYLLKCSIDWIINWWTDFNISMRLNKIPRWTLYCVYWFEKFSIED